MPTCLDETNDDLEEAIDCYDDVATAIEQTRVVFSELLRNLGDARTHLRTSLAFCIEGDDGEVIEPEAWPAALGPKRAALVAMLAHVEESVAIAEGALGPPRDRFVDDRIAALEQQVRELQRELRG